MLKHLCIPTHQLFSTEAFINSSYNIPMRKIVALLIILIAASSLAQNYDKRFDTAWRLVNERYWDLSRLDVDWQDIRQKYEDDALSAKDDDTFYEILGKMYSEIGDNHSRFVSPAQVLEIQAKYQDLPCLGVFSQVGNTEELGNISYKMLDSKIAYLKVPDLASENVAANMRTAIKKLERQNAQSIILDLRDNPGGRLLEMMQAAGIFTNGFLWRTITNWTFPIPYPAIGKIETQLPLVILINGNVNSAAEGLSGALKQKGRATIIGETTAGNVEAVMPFCLRDGSQAWIATGVLAPIGAATWEGRGVIPDIEVESDKALEAAIEFLGQ